MFDVGDRISDGIDLYLARDHFDFLVSVAFLTENTENIHYADLNYSNTISEIFEVDDPSKGNDDDLSKEGMGLHIVTSCIRPSIYRSCGCGRPSQRAADFGIAALPDPIQPF